MKGADLLQTFAGENVLQQGDVQQDRYDLEMRCVDWKDVMT